MASYFLLAAIATLAQAFTKPTTQCSDCNPVYHPLQEIVTAGAPFTVQWKPTTPGTVSIVLYRGPGNNLVLIGPIAEKISNSGSFSWTPDLSLEPDVTRYGLQIINDADGTFQYSTQFGIGNPSYSSVVSSTTTTFSTSTFPTTTVANDNATSVIATVSNTVVLTVDTTTAAESTTTAPPVQPSAKSSTTTSTVSSNKTTSATAPKNSNGSNRLELSFGSALMAIMAAAWTM